VDKNKSYEFKKVTAEILSYNTYAVAFLNPTGK